MRRLTTMIASVFIAGVILVGCTATPAALTADASADLQARVVAVAESAAAGDQTTALARLDELQSTLDAAVTAGDVSPDRAATIQGAIDTVRTDLQPAPEPGVTPAPEPTVDPGISDDGDGGTDDNSGPGNNNGNGNGNDGNGNGNDGNGKGKGD